MARRAADLAEQVGQHERAATYETAVAVWQALMGNRAATRQYAAAAQTRSTGSDVSPVLRAIYALDRGAPSEAIEELHAAEPPWMVEKLLKSRAAFSPYWSAR